MRTQRWMVVMAAAGCMLGQGALVAPAAADYAYPRLHAVMAGMADGDAATVAFFGGSITWGATASDPLRTSWRALVEQELRRRHPRTPLTFVDAAIGGQPSKLGVFRMDRDVLPFAPDLCFVEFAVNDGSQPDGQETMEGIVRKLLAANPDMAIVLVIIGSGWGYSSPALATHIALADHYGLAYIDIVTPVRERMDAGLNTRDILTDGCHPNDRGYRLYTDIVLAELDRLTGLEGAAAEPPDSPLTANRYESARMVELASLGELEGWQTGVPSPTGTWFDHTPSRWMSSVIAPLEAGARLDVTETIDGAGLYYELLPEGKPLRLLADGEVHLTLDTLNKQPFARVAWQFKRFDAPAARTLTLEAPEGGPAAVAYLLLTGGE
jgi:lysophospholipase L1-like esterase